MVMLQRQAALVLRHMKKTMENQDKWCRGALARTKSYTQVAPQDDWAYCFSPNGLFLRIIDDLKKNNARTQVNAVGILVKGALEFCAKRYMEEHCIPPKPERGDFLDFINDEVGRTGALDVIEKALMYVAQDFKGWKEESLEEAMRQINRPLRV